MLLLTITASPQSKTYGTALSLGTTAFTDTGLLPGDSVSSVTLTSDGAAPTATVAGSPYSIIPSAAVISDPSSTSYVIVYDPGLLTVNKATLTVTANNQTKVYGAALPSPLTVTYTGFVNGDSSSSLTTQPTVVTTALATSPAGGYPGAITASGAADPNYTITYAAGTLTVDPASLLITAKDQTTTYGAALPNLTVGPTTVGYTGLQNGDTAPSTLPTLGTTALATSPAGSYPGAITASGAADPNYTITYAAGTLTVDPAFLLITARIKPPLTDSLAQLDCRGERLSAIQVFKTETRPRQHYQHWARQL